MGSDGWEIEVLITDLVLRYFLVGGKLEHTVVPGCVSTGSASESESDIWIRIFSGDGVFLRHRKRLEIECIAQELLRKCLALLVRRARERDRKKDSKRGTGSAAPRELGSNSTCSH